MWGSSDRTTRTPDPQKTDVVKGLESEIWTKYGGHAVLDRFSFVSVYIITI